MKKLILALFFFALYEVAPAQTVTRLIGVSPFQDSLWVFDTTNFSVVRRLAPTPSSGGAITGTNGMAMNQSNGNIFVICKQSATTGRTLGILNPLTGVVTIVGNLGDNFSSITFNGNNTLLGVTGDGATVPETVYRIDQSNASKTVLLTLGNGADGEVICYNPDDNMVYHWSGNGTIVFEKFDTSGVTVTNIPLIGTTNGETFGAVYRSNNTFITSNISSRFQTWQANGTVGAQYGNSSPDDIRGTVLITCSRAITGNTAFCAGDSTLLTHGQSNFVSNYQWYLNGALIPGATSQTYYATQVGHYNVIISDACGTDSSGTGIDVTMNNLPVVTLSGNTTICAGDSTTLTGSSGGTSQWYMNGQPIAGATSNTYNASASGVYNMTKTNANGCTDSAATGITVTVNPLPPVTISLAAASICAGDSIQLFGTTGVSHQWYMDGQPIAGATNDAYTVTMTGVYNMIMTDANGCSDSAAAGTPVMVNPLPVVDLGQDTTTCGTPVMLDAGNPGATYLWCDGSTTQTVVLPVSTSCAVLVTDTNGCTSSDTINVTINALPTVTASALTDSLCLNDPPVPLSGSPMGGTFTGPGTSGITFTPSSAGAGSHDIVYMYTDGNGCSNSDTVTIVVSTEPVATISASSTTVCVDDANATLTGSPAGGTFGGPGVSGSSFDPSVAGVGTHNLTYSYTDPNGCSDNAVMTIPVNACVGINEQQSAGATQLFPNPANSTVQVVVTGTSTVTFYNMLGESVMSVKLTEGTHTLSVAGIAEGMYLVRTENAKGVATQRFVISR